MIAMVKEISIIRSGKRYVMKAGKRYRATYLNGNILEFRYQGSPKYDTTNVWVADAWNVTRRQPAGYRGYCTESSLEFRKVEEVCA